MTPLSFATEALKFVESLSLSTALKLLQKYLVLVFQTISKKLFQNQDVKLAWISNLSKINKQALREYCEEKM